ncbi:unnamed protein product, partial [Iphiclides podalirius]
MRGTRQLVVNGYSFICRSYCLNHVKKNWKCATHADCTAKVHTVNDDIVILNNDHNHPVTSIEWKLSPYVNRGGDLLHFNGYTFNKRNRCAGEKTTWCCTNYYTAAPCPVKMKTLGLTSKILEIKGEHNH